MNYQENHLIRFPLHTDDLIDQLSTTKVIKYFWLILSNLERLRVNTQRHELTLHTHHPLLGQSPELLFNPITQYIEKFIHILMLLNVDWASIYSQGSKQGSWVVVSHSTVLKMSKYLL